MSGLSGTDVRFVGGLGLLLGVLGGRAAEGLAEEARKIARVAVAYGVGHVGDGVGPLLQQRGGVLQASGPNEARRREPGGVLDATGLSASGFIRTRRLQHAAALLQEGADTISDVADAVGYRDPSYFSRLFRETFGCSPTEYAEQESEPPDEPDIGP